MDSDKQIIKSPRIIITSAEAATSINNKSLHSNQNKTDDYFNKARSSSGKVKIIHLNTPSVPLTSKLTKLGKPEWLSNTKNSFSVISAQSENSRISNEKCINSNSENPNDNNNDNNSDLSLAKFPSSSPNANLIECLQTSNSKPVGVAKEWVSLSPTGLSGCPSDLFDSFDKRHRSTLSDSNHPSRNPDTKEPKQIKELVNNKQRNNKNNKIPPTSSSLSSPRSTTSDKDICCDHDDDDDKHDPSNFCGFKSLENTSSGRVNFNKEDGLVDSKNVLSEDDNGSSSSVLIRKVCSKKCCCDTDKFKERDNGLSGDEGVGDKGRESHSFFLQTSTINQERISQEIKKSCTATNLENQVKKQVDTPCTNHTDPRSDSGQSLSIKSLVNETIPSENNSSESFEIVPPVLINDGLTGLKLKFRKRSLSQSEESDKKFSLVNSATKLVKIQRHKRKHKKTNNKNIKDFKDIKIKSEEEDTPTPSEAKSTTKSPTPFVSLQSDAYKTLQIAPKFVKLHPMGSKKPSAEEETTNNANKIPKTSPTSEEVDGYDSDCLVIIEGENDRPSTPNIEVTENHNNNNISSSNENEEVRNTSRNPSPKRSSSSDNPNSPNIDKTGDPYSPTQLLPTLPFPNKSAQNSKKKCHNLPINELKKKLAFCPVCQVQYSSHKAANLCLSKHGKRQCWLCLDVMANSKDSYFQHCVKHHAVGPSSDIVGCPYCQKFFDFRQGFNQHIVKVHFSEDISFVSTTACLSPASLVDLYTGQPRKRVNDYGNEISFRNNRTSRNSTSECPEEIALNPLDGVGGIVQLGSKRSRTAVTRESVIRETPPSNLTNSKAPGQPLLPSQQISFQNFHNHHYLQHLHQFSSSHKNNNINNNISGLNEIRQMQQVNRPQSQPQAQVVTSTSSDIPITSGKHIGGSKNLGSAFIRIGTTSGEGLNLSSSCGDSIPSLMSHSYRGDNTNIPDSPSSSSASSVGSSSYFETHDNNHLGQAKPVSADSVSSLGSVSPSLLEMQRMIQSSQVQMQYFNSVNSMLRTVAECGPHNALVNPDPLPEDATDGSLSQSNCNPSDSTNPERSNDHNSNNSNTQSDLEVFKVPSNIGVKRRILTKWDEHQEKQVDDSQTVSTKISQQCSSREDFHSMSMSFQGSHNSRSRTQQGPERKNFWEQVIRESNAMYTGSSSSCQGQMDYPDEDVHTTHQLTQSQCQDVQETEGNITISQSNYSSERTQTSTHHYPRIMARVDSTGRPIGMFTANGQPCVLSSNPSLNNLYTPNQQDSNDHLNQSSQQYSHHSSRQQGHTHRQYQYKIIPQASSSSSSNNTNAASSNQQCQQVQQPQQVQQQQGGNKNIINNNSGESISSRKRKSSVPIRVVPNPHYDSVVVQNPFEEEDTPLPSPKAPNLGQGQNSQGHPSYRSGSHTLESARGQAIAQWEALLRQQQQYHHLQQNFMTSAGGRIQHCQPKFTTTTGGQITEFPLQSNRTRGDSGSSSNNSSSRSINQSNNGSCITNSSGLNFKDNSSGSSGLIESRFQLDEQQQQGGNVSQDEINNDGIWPPFIVAPRYQEHCHTLLTHLRDLERQRRVDTSVRYRESDI